MLCQLSYCGLKPRESLTTPSYRKKRHKLNTLNQTPAIITKGVLYVLSYCGNQRLRYRLRMLLNSAIPPIELQKSPTEVRGIGI